LVKPRYDPLSSRFLSTWFFICLTFLVLHGPCCEYGKFGVLCMSETEVGFRFHWRKFVCMCSYLLCIVWFSYISSMRNCCDGETKCIGHSCRIYVVSFLSKFKLLSSVTYGWNLIPLGSDEGWDSAITHQLPSTTQGRPRTSRPLLAATSAGICASLKMHCPYHQTAPTILLMCFIDIDNYNDLCDTESFHIDTALPTCIHAPIWYLFSTSIKITYIILCCCNIAIDIFANSAYAWHKHALVT
jgi:hypothetical protein